MNRIKLLLVSFTLLSLFLISRPTISANPVNPDPLWQKAVAIATANRNLTPGKMMIISQEIDDKGKVVHSEETWMRYYPGTDAQIQVELIKAVDNGKDVTKECQQKMKKEQSKKEKTSRNDAKTEDSLNINPFEGIPFTEDTQAFVSFKPLNQKETIREKACEIYEYTFARDKKNTYKGKAWLEEGTGIPVQIRYIPQPLPKHVTRMETTVVFTQTDTQFHPSEVRVEGSGGILFIRKNMRMTMKLSDFWVFQQKF